MIKTEHQRKIIAYVRLEGFELDSVSADTLLMKKGKVCHAWLPYGFTYDALVLAVYAILVEPPLLYN